MDNALTVTDLTLQYHRANLPALVGVSFALTPSEILSIVGPSGSGKSTLLRSICGLEKPQKGTITLGENIVTDDKIFVRPDKRRMGLVSQTGDLFPHLTVARNIAFGLKKWSRTQKKERVAELLEAIDLPGLEKRYPHELSGGEAQRIALARAIAPKPSLLLMDEPFSNLDTGLRESLRRLTRKILKKENTTTIFITHHPDDALAFGDRVGVMDQGKLVQLGEPQEVWAGPQSPVAALLFGSVNHLHPHFPDLPTFLRADEITLSKDPAQGFASGKITAIEQLGSHQRCFISIDEHPLELTVLIPNQSECSPNQTVGLMLK